MFQVRSISPYRQICEDDMLFRHKVTWVHLFDMEKEELDSGRGNGF